MPSRKNPSKGRQFTAEVILWANGIENIARELYVNALNFGNALAYRFS